MKQCLLVIDFNGTLLRRVKDSSFAELDVNLDDQIAVENIESETLLIRPLAKAFARFLHERNIDYCFWTTAPRDEAENLYQVMKSKYGFEKSQFLLSAEDCLESGTVILENYHTPVTRLAKDLNVVWRRIGHKPENVLLVDDSDHKVIDEHIHNFLQISEFNPLKPNLRENNEDLLQLMHFLDHMFALQNNEIDTCSSFLKKTNFKEWCRKSFVKPF